MHPSTLAKRSTVLLFLALIVFYLYGLGHFPLLGPDEPRYAQIAREMFLRQDLITPTLGGHLWFEKPALLYWMMIASFKLFGVSEWSARVGPAVSGLLTVAAVFWLGRQVERAGDDAKLGALGFWSALVAGSMIGIVAFSRAASFDIVLTMTATWGLAFFLAGEFEGETKRRLRLFAGFYIFVGLSLLAKGLVGIVVPFGVVIAYYALRWRLPERSVASSLLWGLPLSILIAASWYGPVIWKHGWPFIDQFFIQHHFARFVTDKYRHPAPVYYYLLIFVALTLPWSALVIEGTLKAGKQFWRRDETPGPDTVNKFQAFTIAWLALPLIFFSFSSSKLPGYILPVFPAAALIVGARLSRLELDPANNKWANRITSILCLLFSAAVLVFVQRSATLSMTCGLLIAAPLAVAGVVGVQRESRSVFAMMLGGATLATVLIILNCGGGTKWVERESAKQLLQLADARGYSQAVIYGMQRSDRSPEFYAAGRVAYDPEGEPIMYEGVGQIIWQSGKRGTTILSMIPVEDVNQLSKNSSVSVDVIGDNGRYALVAVGPRQ